MERWLSKSRVLLGAHSIDGGHSFHANRGQCST